VDDDLVVEGAEQDAVLDGGRAAVGLVLGVVHFAGAGGLGAAAGPLAVPVPQQDRVADPGRDRLGVPDVQRQAGAAEAGAELPAPQTSDAVKLSSCLGKFCGGGGECDGFVVVLAGEQAVVQAAEQAGEQVALGGGVPVAGVFAAVVVGAGAG
jgi:hypothetical protein